MIIEPSPIPSLGSSRPKLTKVLLVSVLLHLILGGVLLFQRFKVNPIEEQTISTIEASLVWFPPPPQPEVTKESVQSPAQVEQLTPESAPKDEILEIEESVETEKPVIDPIVDELPQQPAPAQQNHPQQELPAIESPMPSKPAIVIRNLAQQHLQGIQQRADQQFIQKQAQTYRQQQLSPKLTGNKIDPFITEDEKLLQKQTVKINCENGAAKTLAIVSYFTGGMLKCTPNGNFAPYIKKHLNKGVEPIKQTSPTK